MVIHRASNTPSHDRQRVYCVKAGHKLCQSLAGRCNFACFPAQLHDMGGVDPCDLQEEFASSWLYCGIHRLPKSHLFSILCPTTTVWRALWHNQFPAGAQRYNNNNPNLTPHRTQNTWRAWGVNYPHAGGAREGPKPLSDFAADSRSCSTLYRSSIFPAAWLKEMLPLRNFSKTVSISAAGSVNNPS